MVHETDVGDSDGRHLGGRTLRNHEFEPDSDHVPEATRPTTSARPSVAQAGRLSALRFLMWKSQQKTLTMTPPRYEIINGSQNTEHRHTQRGEHIQDVEGEFWGADAVA